MEDMTPCLHPFDRLELKAVLPPLTVTVECMLCGDNLHLTWPVREV